MYVSNTNKITKHHEQGGRDLIGGVSFSNIICVLRINLGFLHDLAGTDGARVGSAGRMAAAGT